jgi:translocator protein
MSFLDSPPDPKKSRALKFFLVATLAVGASASVFTVPNVPTWYAGLRHPVIAPPNAVFAPVWTTLYVLMAVAAWRVWRKTGLKSAEMAVFALQLALNFAWSAIFFGLHRIGAALIEIIALDMLVLATIVLFLRRDKWAGVLLLPYLAWLLFATALTRAFWQLN